MTPFFAGTLLVVLGALVVAAALVALIAARPAGRAVLAWLVLIAIAIFVPFSAGYRRTQVEMTQASAAGELSASTIEEDTGVSGDGADVDLPGRDQPARSDQALHLASTKASAGAKAIERPTTGPPESAKLAQTPTETNRPSWVDAPAGLVNGVYQTVVTVGPYKTADECEQNLDQKLQEAVEEYAARRLGPEAASRIRLPPEYVRRRLIKHQWAETFLSPTPSIGSMVQLHVLLTFDREFTEQLDLAWKRVLVAERVRWAGIGLAGILALLAVAYGYLKVDLATRGMYRWRLRLAAAVMILGVVAGLLAARPQ